MQPRFKAIAVVGFLTVAPTAASAQRGDECWDKINSVHSGMVQRGFSPDGDKLEQDACSFFNSSFRQMAERCDFNLYRQSGQEMLRQNGVRFRQCQIARQEWCTPQLTADQKLLEARHFAAAAISRWRAQCRNVD